MLKGPVPSSPPDSAFVARFDAGGPGPGAPLLPDGEGREVAHGPLRVAWSWPADPAPVDEQRLLLLGGAVYNLDELGGGGDARDPLLALAGLLRRDGDDLLPRLRGDFALLVWDRVTGVLTVARDHMGGRAVVWHEAGGRITAASEVRHALAALPRRPAPDDTAVATWISRGMLPAERTLYAGVRRLAGGCALTAGPEGASVRRYWLPSYERPSPTPRAEIAARLRAALGTAVSRRCAGGELSAVLLSGGLDSSSVAGVAGGLPGDLRPRRAYSAVFPEHADMDESALIEQLVGAMSLEGTRIAVRDGSVLAGALEYLDAWEVPPMSPNVFFWLPLLRRARSDGVLHLLDGEGGDEVFGASAMLLADRVRHGRLRAARRLNLSLPAPPGGPSPASVRAVMRRFGWLGALPPGAHGIARTLRGGRGHGPAWMRDSAARAVFEAEDPTAWKRLNGPRWWSWLVERTVLGQGPALGYDHMRRRNALAGLDARHPLVDVDLLELVLRQPPEEGFDPVLSRPLLREAVASIVPDEVRLRPEKRYFTPLFLQALTGADLPLVRELLSDDGAEVGAYVELPSMRRRMLEPPAGGRLEWGHYVWRLANAELWLRMQGDRRLPRRALETAGRAHDYTVPA